MARLLGYMANRTDRLPLVLEHERRALAAAPSSDSSPSGWGLGFYQGGEVLHRKRPRSDQDADWHQLGKDIVSDCVLMHLRQPTVGDFRTQNTHPFRMRSWLFAHKGTIPGFAQLKPSMLSTLPDFLKRNIRGETDSELLFHILLSHLNAEGALDAHDVHEQLLLDALRRTVDSVDRASQDAGEEHASLNLLLTNGRSMMAFRRGAPMAYVERRGVGGDAGDKPGSPAILRYAMVASGVGIPADEQGWKTLDDGEVLLIDRQLHPKSLRLSGAPGNDEER